MKKKVGKEEEIEVLEGTIGMLSKKVAELKKWRKIESVIIFCLVAVWVG